MFSISEFLFLLFNMVLLTSPPLFFFEIQSQCISQASIDFPRRPPWPRIHAILLPQPLELLSSSPVASWCLGGKSQVYQLCSLGSARPGLHVPTFCYLHSDHILCPWANPVVLSTLCTVNASRPFASLYLFIYFATGSLLY